MLFNKSFANMYKRIIYQKYKKKSKIYPLMLMRRWRD